MATRNPQGEKRSKYLHIPRIYTAFFSSGSFIISLDRLSKTGTIRSPDLTSASHYMYVAKGRQNLSYGAGRTDQINYMTKSVAVTITLYMT